MIAAAPPAARISDEQTVLAIGNYALHLGRRDTVVDCIGTIRGSGRDFTSG
jgi:hypothetical protein